MKAQQNIRGYRLNMRITDKTRERLEAIAEDLGLAPATVASYALSEWVSNKCMQQRMILKATSLAATLPVEEEQLELIPDQDV